MQVYSFTVFGVIEIIKNHFPHSETVKSLFGLFLIILLWLLFCPSSTPGKRVNLRKSQCPECDSQSHKGVCMGTMAHPDWLALFGIHLHWSFPLLLWQEPAGCLENRQELTHLSRTCTAAPSIWRPRLLRGDKRLVERDSENTLQKQHLCSWHHVPSLSSADRWVCSHWKFSPKFVVLIQAAGEICCYSSLQEQSQQSAQSSCRSWRDCKQTRWVYWQRIFYIAYI